MWRTLDSTFENLGRIYLADTFVVKETHWLTKVRGVEPVMSSHWAGVVPPETQANDLLPKMSRLFTKCFLFEAEVGNLYKNVF